MPKLYFTGPRGPACCKKTWQLDPNWGCNCTNCRTDIQNANSHWRAAPLGCRSRSCKCAKCKKGKLLGIIGRGDVAAMTALLKKNPEMVNSISDVSPLMYAVNKDRPTIVKLLVQHGADTTLGSYTYTERSPSFGPPLYEIRTITAVIPVFYAALNRPCSLEVALALVSTADLNYSVPLYLGGGTVWTALLHRHKFPQDAHDNERYEALLIELLRHIFKRKAAGDPCPELNEPGEKGTLLQMAVDRNLPDAVTYLIRMGANAYGPFQDSYSLVKKLDSARLYGTPMSCLLERVFKCGSVALDEYRTQPLELASLARISRKHTDLKKIGKYTWKHILSFAFTARPRGIFRLPNNDCELTVASEAIRGMLMPAPPPPPPPPKNLYTVNPLLQQGI
uniref:Uncharacterized protein n=1 Tax=viral metagenome TaxID=1070528 RepID=A0A6C0KBG5_9ZZZZ